ncbi:ATP-binding protein [Streptomyces sp. NPDC020917]|uniref:ATP-binding protein n=1 Tax=Streptomyces sp. NPDC020917 TaxID=3365102 RepID=UPI0037B291DF
MTFDAQAPAAGLPVVVRRLFEAEPQSVHAAREFAAAALDCWGPLSRTEDVRLCVSELASNALTHGTSRDHCFLVVLDHDGTRVRVEVHDSRGRDEGAEPKVRRPGEGETRGRGLLIVDAVADRWGVEAREPLGKVVWAEFGGARER